MDLYLVLERLKQSSSFGLLIITAWKVSNYGVTSGPYFPVFSPNTGKYRPEITQYLDTFHVVYKSKHRFIWKGKQNLPQKRFHLHCVQDCHNGIDDWEFTLFKQYEMHKQLKESETFWQHKLETFYPLGLNEKEEYLF